MGPLIKATPNRKEFPHKGKGPIMVILSLPRLTFIKTNVVREILLYLILSRSTDNKKTIFNINYKYIRH